MIIARHRQPLPGSSHLSKQPPPLLKVSVMKSLSGRPVILSIGSILFARTVSFVPTGSRKKKRFLVLFIFITNKCVHCMEDGLNSLSYAASAWLFFTSTLSPLVAHYRADP